LWAESKCTQRNATIPSRKDSYKAIRAPVDWNPLVILLVHETVSDEAQGKYEVVTL